MDADTGEPATASQTAFSKLREGYKLNGVVLAVTSSGARIFKPAAAKGAHKSWDDFLCDSAAVVKSRGSHSLVGLFGDGKVRAYTIPSLKEINAVPLDKIMDVRRFGEARISPSGDVLGWAGPSELATINVWGAGLRLYVKSLIAARICNTNTRPGASLTILFIILPLRSHHARQYRIYNG
jgi:hypothetical protein